MPQVIEKKYAVVSSGKTKEGKPYSKCYRINETKGGSSYLNPKDIIYLDDNEPLLKIVTTKTSVM